MIHVITDNILQCKDFTEQEEALILRLCDKHIEMTGEKIDIDYAPANLNTFYLTFKSQDARVMMEMSFNIMNREIQYLERCLSL